MDNNNAKPQQNQLSIEINPQTTKVSYSNLAIISHSRSEFVLDFATTLPGLPTPSMCPVQAWASVSLRFTETG